MSFQEMISDDERLLTWDEAEAYLQISRSTMYRLLESGDLKGYKVSTQWRFYKGDLRACIVPGGQNSLLPNAEPVLKITENKEVVTSLANDTNAFCEEGPKVAGERSFTEWLGKQKDTNTPIGEFAREVLQDLSWPSWANQKSVFTYYLRERKYSNETCETLNVAWDAYKEYEKASYRVHTVNFPIEVSSWLKESAKLNHRSFDDEIVFLLSQIAQQKKAEDNHARIIESPQSPSIGPRELALVDSEEKDEVPPESKLQAKQQSIPELAQLQKEYRETLDDSTLVSAKEAAEYLECAISTIERRAVRGKITGHRNEKGEWYFHLKDLEDYKVRIEEEKQAKIKEALERLDKIPSDRHVSYQRDRTGLYWYAKWREGSKMQTAYLGKATQEIDNEIEKRRTAKEENKAQEVTEAKKPIDKTEALLNRYRGLAEDLSLHPQIRAHYKKLVEDRAFFEQEREFFANRLRLKKPATN